MIQQSHTYPAQRNTHDAIIVFTLVVLGGYICMASPGLASETPSRQPKLTLNMAALKGYPPFAMFDGHRFSGIDYDILRELSKRANIDIIYHLMPWKRALKMIQSGAIEATFSAYYKPERAIYAEYIETPTHYDLYTLFVKPENKFDFKRIEDLKGKTIVTILGFFYGREFHDFVTANHIKLHEVKNFKQSIAMTVNEHVDVMVGNYYTMAYHFRKIKRGRPLISLSPPLGSPMANHIILSRKADIPHRKEIMARINTHLTQMRRDGVIASVGKNYISVDWKKSNARQTSE